jgi:hypothetical protein
LRATLIPFPITTFALWRIGIFILIAYRSRFRSWKICCRGKIITK